MIISEITSDAKSSMPVELVHLSALDNGWKNEVGFLTSCYIVVKFCLSNVIFFFCVSVYLINILSKFLT